MSRQLSFMQQLFPCASGACKGNSEVAFKVTTTYYPHGKQHPRAWTCTDLYCEECADRIRRTMASNPIAAKYNDVKIERI